MIGWAKLSFFLWCMYRASPCTYILTYKLMIEFLCQNFWMTKNKSGNEKRKNYCANCEGMKFSFRTLYGLDNVTNMIFSKGTNFGSETSILRIFNNSVQRQYCILPIHLTTPLYPRLSNRFSFTCAKIDKFAIYSS